MPLGEYPFNPYYVWFADRFGLSWQFLLASQMDKPVHVDICLLFSEGQVGLAKPFLEKALTISPMSQRPSNVVGLKINLGFPGRLFHVRS